MMNEYGTDQVLEISGTSCSQDGDEWDFAFDNMDESSHSVVTTTFPMQLHPAVTMGMKHVSSCAYFSMNGSEATNSVADLLSLLGEENENSRIEEQGIDILYHDILMHVFAFLDANSLCQFSQTARRPNFECFYFLQLELQRAIVCVPPSTAPPDDENTYYETTAALSGSGCLSRLAQRDHTAAKAIVQTYVNSNSSLRTMPLSHSLAYLRHVLRRHGFPHDMATSSASNNSDHKATTRSPSQALASAALFITMVGAASSLMEFDSSQAYTLFQYGLGGALMASTAQTAAKTIMMQQQPSQHEREHEPQEEQQRQRQQQVDKMSMRKTAEEMARMMQDLPHQMWQQLQQLRQERQSYLNHCQNEEKSEKPHISPNPYTHQEGEQLKMPSGCVGAYSRAVHDASSKLRDLLKQERKRNFEALGEDERLDMSRQFLEACTSDDGLDIVKDMLIFRKCMDVDGFYEGPDGAETCGLHTAAFHGACRVLEFLVKGIDEENPDQDGGLANVNLTDGNNWTAMHFCAGANSVEAVRILANHGAQLSLEANNGYTPFHWAQRLSNNDVAEELQRLGADQRFLEIGWLRQQPLSAIASRFFAIAMPTH